MLFFLLYHLLKTSAESFSILVCVCSVCCSGRFESHSLPTELLALVLRQPLMKLQQLKPHFISLDCASQQRQLPSDHIGSTSSFWHVAVGAAGPAKLPVWAMMVQGQTVSLDHFWSCSNHFGRSLGRKLINSLPVNTPAADEQNLIVSHP